MSSEPKTTIERGSFTVCQGGMTVASGSGPYDDVKHEAAHYAAVYRQDGPVTVTVRRLAPPVASNQSAGWKWGHD